MNMTVPAAISAMPNGTTRPQLRIVIVGHVDHGKSTLVGRLLHETGSLPEGKLEMLKAVSARRGMPFEWSFLLDALQTERVQKRICVVSMVMPWSRSVCSASSRNDHSNGMPRRALTALSISSLPSGRLPVSCKRRPTRVDLP